MEENKNLLIGMDAPDFSANTTFGKINLCDYKGKWLILFSHPGDFTPVCTTEFIMFSKNYNEFKNRNCELLGLSIDTIPCHLEWINNINKSTGINVTFPIIADTDKSVSKKYNMFSNNLDTIRKVFFIDPNQKIRCILDYPKTCGRNIYEILRILDSLQNTDENNTYTPANWTPNQATIIPPPKTYNEMIENVNNTNNGTLKNCLNWYLCFNETIPN